MGIYIPKSPELADYPVSKWLW